MESDRKYLDGWLVHYNFFRPHMSLNDQTPASVAGIKFPFRNWKDIVEQPYEKTARIPIKDYVPESDSTVTIAVTKNIVNIERRLRRKYTIKSQRRV
jgi:hypothetical protein